MGDELLEFAVFVIHEAEAFGVADFKAAKLVPPLVKSGLADAVATAEFGDGRTSLMFLEGEDDLFFGVACFHVELCAAFAANSQLIAFVSSCYETKEIGANGQRWHV